MSNSKKTAATKAAEPTREELLKRIAELENKVQQPKDLQQAIDFYKEKQRKIKDLANFEFHQQELSEAFKVVQEKSEAGDFEAKNYRLMLSTFREYGEGQKVFSVTNPVIIAACVSFILDKIDEKAADLRKEIAQ
ncbi:MAG: hypothetical protein PF694_09220 [Bacteroidetes bacterium]|jgi:hypothetical protein|nr:hypothetical protein [Bacteroidota bacterium]